MRLLRGWGIRRIGGIVNFIVRIWRLLGLLMFMLEGRRRRSGERGGLGRWRRMGKGRFRSLWGSNWYLASDSNWLQVCREYGTI
jgi:hypothetical protein